MQIRFFGWVGFVVRFPGIRWTGPRYVYTLDLKEGKGYLRMLPAKSPEERNG